LKTIYDLKKALFLALLWSISITSFARQENAILIEAEGFDHYGGWLNDTQFMDIMGSPYLIAHGMGTPVEDARTTVNCPKSGKYRIWVRTCD